MCEVFIARCADILLPTGGGAGLSERDTARRVTARRMPVLSIGYRRGSTNNAGFYRAFGRRFGLPPSHLRHGRAA